MVDGIFAILLLFVLSFAIALLYRSRFRIAKWMQDTSMAKECDPRRRKIILERKIEDAQYEIDLLNEMEETKEQGDK